jgi:hypothetical protein
MWNQLRPQFTGLHLSQRQNGKLVGLKMNHQLEPVGKQSLHHQAHLVLGRIPHNPRVNRIAIAGYPFGQVREHLPFLIFRRPKIISRIM